jgi:hypothetical protein
MKIAVLKNSQIDRRCYDDVIMSSEYGTVYAMSWYLDTVSPDWQLLMADNYKYVMPLPVKRKYGIKVALQPMFCQQLGVFSNDKITDDIFEEFLNKIPCHIYTLNGNIGNRPINVRGTRFLPRLNYVLTEKKYRENFLRNVKKSQKENLYLNTDTEWTSFLDMLKTHTPGRPIHEKVPLADNIFCRLRKHCNIEVWSVKNGNGEMLSAAMFLYWKNRVYYMLPVSSVEGKRCCSMAFLLDNFIDVCVENNLILDFEGSSLPQVARYYESTGAVKETYYLFQKPSWLFR